MSPSERIVALVASAGGVDAVSRILRRLPARFGAPIIVLIHQQPDRVSSLVDVLARGSGMPVVAAEHGAELPSGQVVVVPPGTHLLVTCGGRILLIPSGQVPPSRPSADLLLATLATATGPRAIAVILSGGGHDGATGATAVHACGGTVIATDEATSAHFSMPLAAIERDDAVDRIVALDEVADVLVALTEDDGGDQLVGDAA
jgi:two-component system chemotaxis response regulator CheB